MKERLLAPHTFKRADGIFQVKEHFIVGIDIRNNNSKVLSGNRDREW